MRIAAAALAIVSSLAFTSSAPGREGLPPARAHHALVYDPVARRVLLTGGSTPRDSGRSFEFFNDLWAFDGRRWVALASSGGRLSGIRLAFDTRRGRLVAFFIYRAAWPRFAPIEAELRHAFACAGSRSCTRSCRCVRT